MQNDPTKSAEILRLWARAPVPTERADGDPERRQHLIRLIAKTIEGAARQRRRRTRLKWMTVLAVASVVVCAFGLNFRSRWLARSPRLSRVIGPARIVHQGRALSAAENIVLVESDEVATGDNGRTTLGMPSGTQVDINELALVQLLGAAQIAGATKEEVSLEGGSIQVEVPKLPPGGTFRVRTPDALITVHGTAFSVSVAGSGSDLVTHVAVKEGVVTVDDMTGQSILRAGMEWRSPPPVPPTVVQVAPAFTEEESRAPAPPGPSWPLPSARPRVEPRSDKRALSRQNQVFGDAMAARQRGEERVAVTLLNEFVARFPDSPLLQNAYVERFRALDHLGDSTGASTEARHYLSRFPDGFGREEATRLLAKSPIPQ